MRHKWILFAAVLVLIAAIAAGYLYEEAPPTNTDTPVETPDIDTGNFTIAPTADINSLHLRDVGSLYSAEPEDVVTMYLTVREGNASDGTNHTWQEVNTYSAYYYDELGIDRYKVAALLQVGDENGPVEGLLGYGQTIPNATVQIRGQTSSRNAPHAASTAGGTVRPSACTASASAKASIEAAAQTMSLPYRETPACPCTRSDVLPICTVIIPAAPPARPAVWPSAPAAAPPAASSG